MSQENLSKYILVVADQLDLSIPAECATGVRANLELLLHHGRIVASADDPMRDLAEEFQP